MLPHRDHLGYNKLNVAQRATLATPFPRSHPRLDRETSAATHEVIHPKGAALGHGRLLGTPKLGVGVTTQNVVRRCERPKRLSFCQQQCRDSKQVPCASTVWITPLRYVCRTPGVPPPTGRGAAFDSRSGSRMTGLVGRRHTLRVETLDRLESGSSHVQGL